MNKYPDFWSTLLSNRPGFLLAFLVIACIGALAIMFSEANKRDPASPRTPPKFSFKFWLADNALRIPGTIMLMYLAVRGCMEFIPAIWMLPASIGIGLGSDKLAIVGKKIGLLATNKLAQSVAEKINAKEEQK